MVELRPSSLPSELGVLTPNFADMKIQAGPHVGDDGTFYHPILSQWKMEFSLVQVIGEMKNAFLQTTPVGASSGHSLCPLLTDVMVYY